MTSQAQKDANKRYREKNKEKLKEYLKEYYKKHPEKFKSKNKQEYLKEYYKKNKEKSQEYHKEYYKKNKADYLAREKEYKKDPEWRKRRWKSRKLSEKKSGKFEARKRYYDNIAIKLSLSDKKCQICGALKSQFHHIEYNQFYIGYHLCQKHHREAHKNPSILLGLNIKNYNNLVKSKKI